MKNLTFKFILSVIALYSMMLAGTAKAAPVQFNQVTQVVNAKPGKASTGGFEQLRLVGDDPIVSKPGDDTKTDTPPAPQQQDERVITETKAEIVQDEACDCENPLPGGKKFPYAWLALGGVPLLFLIPHDKDKTPTPTMTPTETPTMTPTITPTPPPEPVPEPMTILLFGTGLAGIGLAARRKFGKKSEVETEV